MTIAILDGTGTSRNYETGNGDGSGTPFTGPVSARLGEVTASPASNTVLARLKDLLSLIVLAAGENHVGQHGTPGDVIDITLSLDTSAYDAGDVLADTQTITNAVRVTGGRAILQSVTVIDEDDQGVALDLYFMSTSRSLGTENSAPNISDANARDILGFVAVASGDYKDLGGVRIATVRNIGLLLEAAGGSRDLYVGATTGGTPTYTASGLKLRLGFTWH